MVTEQEKTQNSCIPRKPPQKKAEVLVSGAEIQTLAVDTRTAVWVSTAEKNRSERNSENFSKVWGGLSSGTGRPKCRRPSCAR